MYEIQKGIWKLIAPNGDTWEGGSPLHCLRKEKDERIPDSVQLERLVAFLEEDDWIDFLESRPKPGQMCIVACGPDNMAQIIPLRWCHYDEEFYWHDQAQDFELDPFPTETVTYWMPWPNDPAGR